MVSSKGGPGLGACGRYGKITAVEAQQKRRRRVNVYLDDQFAFSLSEVVAGRASLRPGIYLSASDVARLDQEDAAQVALDSALGYLACRPRSERELRQNLVRKGITPERVEQVVARLKELSLLDDAAFAQFWVENRDRFSPRGALALRSELFGKGVERETIDEAIAQGADEEGRARAVAEKKLPRLRGLDYRTYYGKLVALLARRGFSYEVASHVARDLWQDGGDEATIA